MGSGRWSSKDWADTRSAYSASAAPTVDHIYKSRAMNSDLDPINVKIRESRDSDDNPNSTALIVGLDVTGSMSHVLDAMAREGLGTLVHQIYDRKPISDPHVMIMGIGDMEWDNAPLQVTQFEAENQPLVTQMENIYLERGGGGNHYESYIAAWLFAAHRTSIDCFEKRGKRGYLFTVGDEEPTPLLKPESVKEFLGGETGFTEEELTAAALWNRVTGMYDTYHIIVSEGSYASMHRPSVQAAWASLIGQKVIVLEDHTKLAEVVVSAIQVAEGASKDDVANSWSGDTSVAVKNALKNVEVPSGSGDDGVMLNY